MANYWIKPSLLSGTIDIPASKSHSIRAIILASLAKGVSRIVNVLNSSDVSATILAMRKLGAVIDEDGSSLKVKGVDATLPQETKEINAKNSGQILRFIGALSALGQKQVKIFGDESICSRRPVEALVSALRQMKASANYLEKKSHAPIAVQGPAVPSKVKMEGKDSQPVSAILLLSAFLPGVSEITVFNAGEKPWIDLTLSWLDRLNISYERVGYEFYRIYGKSSVSAFSYCVPGDFSTSTFPATCALLNKSKITLNHLDFDDPQGDRQFFDCLKQMGGDVLVYKTKKQVTVKGKKSILGLKVDVNPIIDSVPILSVLGCFASSNTEILNAHIARKKESDRLHAMATELKKMGGRIDERKDQLIIHPSNLIGARLNSHNDHRVAMALSVAALHARGPSTIENVGCIEKSFPNFLDSMRKIGAQIDVV